MRSDAVRVKCKKAHSNVAKLACCVGKLEPFCWWLSCSLSLKPWQAVDLGSNSPKRVRYQYQVPTASLLGWFPSWTAPELDIDQRLSLIPFVFISIAAEEGHISAIASTSASHKDEQ